MSEVTRVQYNGSDFVEPSADNTPPPTAPAPNPAPQINAEPGVIRTHRNADGSTEVSHSGPVRMNANELFSSPDATGILSTAVNDFGRPVSGNELTPKTIVKAGGMTMSLAAAEHAKLVTRNPDGSYRETTAEEKAQGTTTQDDEPAREAFASQTDEQALTSFATAVPTHIQHTLIAKVVSGAEIPRALIDEAAASMGKTPEAFAADVRTVFGAFQSQAVEAVKSLGLADEDLPGFEQWAQANHKNDLADAIRQQVYSRSTKGFKELANQYMRAMPPSVEALQAAGYRVSRSGDGRTVTVFIGGQEISLEAAAKQGLI